MSEPSYGEIAKEFIGKTEGELSVAKYNLKYFALKKRQLQQELKRYKAILKDWEEREK